MVVEITVRAKSPTERPGPSKCYEDDDWFPPRCVDYYYAGVEKLRWSEKLMTWFQKLGFYFLIPCVGNHEYTVIVDCVNPFKYFVNYSVSFTSNFIVSVYFVLITISLRTPQIKVQYLRKFFFKESIKTKIRRRPTKSILKMNRRQKSKATWQTLAN